MDFITPQQVQIFGQLLLAVFLGSVLGIERTLAHRFAGFRTFAMVSLGACGFTIISALVAQYAGTAPGFDPTRIAGQIVTGIGFLAGGLIIMNKDTVHGLTTSAGLWVSAAIGMAVGFEFYGVAVSMTVLAVLIFGLFWQLEQKIVGHEREKE